MASRPPYSYRGGGFFGEGRFGGVDIPDLVPAVVFPAPELPSRPAVSEAVGDSRMEIMIGDDRRVIVNADVDGPALAQALKVLGRR